MKHRIRAAPLGVGALVLGLAMPRAGDAPSAAPPAAAQAATAHPAALRSANENGAPALVTEVGADPSHKPPGGPQHQVSEPAVGGPAR